MTKFIAYDVYRADCTRLGFVDPQRPTWSGLPSAFNMTSGDGRMLYMEFGAQQLISKGLPDGTDREGLAVEIQINFGARSTGSWNTNTNSFFALGFCDGKIAPDSEITYANMPTWSVYRRPGLKYADITGYSMSNRNAGGWWVGENYGSATLISYKEYSPVEILYAIENTALCIRSQMYTGNVLAAELLATGSYKPYLEIAYGIVKPEVNGRKPNNGYISPYTKQELNWGYLLSDGQFAYNEPGETAEIVDYHYIIGGEAGQKNSVIMLTPNGSEEAREITIDGNANTYVLPQDILDSGGFKWKVGVTSVFDAFSEYSNEMTITTVDSIPSTVIVAPKNTYVNTSEAAVFEWQHVISTGSPQSRYELQVHVGGEWKTLEEKETALTSAVIPAEQLSSTITAWRVRTANNDGVYGEFSDPASVVLIVAPHVSGVAVTGNVLPVVSWQSDDQQGYEVMVDDASTGVHYGTQKTYTWQELLADGAHTVKVRAVNRFGLFSEWVSLTHTVANAGLETAPVLTAVTADGLDVELRWTGAGYSTVHIYRDGVLLDKLTGYATQYTDHTATGRHVYSVRVSDTSGNYADSAPAVADPRIRDAAIAVEGVWDWVRLVYAPGADAPQRSVSLAPVYALNYYSGRTYPAVEMSAHRSAAYSVTYALDDAGDAERLRGMLGRVVVHKRRDELLRGLLQSVSEVRTCWGEEVTLSIVEVSDD